MDWSISEVHVWQQMRVMPRHGQIPFAWDLVQLREPNCSVVVPPACGRPGKYSMRLVCWGKALPA